MKIKTRIFLGFFIIYVIVFYFIVDLMVNEIRPRYLETTEESMNDTAHLLASHVESMITEKGMDLRGLEKMFSGAGKKSFAARIYGMQKTGVDISVYVTDKNGIVLYDSQNGTREGRDFSGWNDVYQTLRGGYGARSSRKDPADASTGSLYVAAPIKNNNRIMGVLTVVKPEKSVKLFMDLARRKIVIAGVLSCLVFIILGIALSMWINKPILKLTNYIRDLKRHKRVQPPKLGTSEIRDLGKAFEDMKQELEGKKYIEKYIQTFTHELKSPLSSVIGAAELLQEDMPPEQRSRFSGNILSESRRIENIIQKMLQLSSIENRTGLNKIETLNPDSVIAEVIESLSPQIRQKNISVSIKSEGSYTIEGEFFLIRHSLSNLLQNAVEFSGENSEVIIDVRRQSTNVIIGISDEGEGIPEYALDKIFDRFYSLPGKNRIKKGTGLGLAFVREVADLHGGMVSISNNEFHGVTALLSIPSVLKS